MVCRRLKVVQMVQNGFRPCTLENGPQTLCPRDSMGLAKQVNKGTCNDASAPEEGGKGCFQTQTETSQGGTASIPAWCAG